ncbi:MAG: MgtC/SapB family protein [Prolixibacteraceae bacterium]|jgi:putative Mg2+ transporter-C (MgtC) family protein|nr:MgtC/SapB family protein [Prolixibacteraceae bacterium]
MDKLFSITTELTTQDMIFRIIISMFLGLVIGIERETQRQPAGLRTHTLICVGSTLLMLISIFIPQHYYGIYNLDPTRIAAQVVTGIGFVGAGAIIKMGANIRGLTTAATIWATGAIGLAAGSGMCFIALISTALVIFILFFFNLIEKYFLSPSSLKTITIKTPSQHYNLNTIERILKDKNTKIRSHNIESDYANRKITYELIVHIKNNTAYDEIQKALKKADPDISSIMFRDL